MYFWQASYVSIWFCSYLYLLRLTALPHLGHHCWLTPPLQYNGTPSGGLACHTRAVFYLILFILHLHYVFVTPLQWVTLQWATPQPYFYHLYHHPPLSVLFLSRFGEQWTLYRTVQFLSQNATRWMKTLRGRPLQIQVQPMLFCIFLGKMSEEALLTTHSGEKSIADCGWILSKSPSPSIYLWKALEEQLGCRAEGAFNQSTNPFNRCRAKTNWLTQRTPNGINLHKQTRIETQTTRTQLFVKSKHRAARVWPIYNREDQTRGVSGQLSHLQHVEILKRTVSTNDVAISILLSHFKIAKLFPIFSKDNNIKRRRRRRW